jgi:Raf kinase inhibitor-like YbhB/YbcL family protein
MARGGAAAARAIGALSRPLWPGLALALVSACQVSAVEPSSPAGWRMETMAVTSKSFPSNGDIPVDYTCDGAERSPQLTWSAPPPHTKSFVVIAEDPDASGGTFTHWIVYGIGPDVLALPEGADIAAMGASAGLNDNKRPGYGGPCPPKLEIHHYLFRVFALDTPLQVKADPNRNDIGAAMDGHVLGEGAVVGTFSH